MAAPLTPCVSALPLLNAVLQQGMKLSLIDEHDGPPSVNDMMPLGTVLSNARHLEYCTTYGAYDNVSATLKFSALAAAVSGGRMPGLHTLTVKVSLVNVGADKVAVVLPLVAAAASCTGLWVTVLRFTVLRRITAKFYGGGA
jgi:hypothetical protein